MYSTSSNTLTINDSPANIDFHIRSGDYFAFLATRMGFVEEALERCNSADVLEKERSMTRELRNDLRYVQANYEIMPREPVDIQTVRGKGDQLKGCE